MNGVTVEHRRKDGTISGTPARAIDFDDQTAVNVHSPGPRTAKLRAKVALGPWLISKYVSLKLRDDEVTRFVCRDLRDTFGMRLIHGAEGFLVIESTHSLDVVAVYTAGPVAAGVASIDVEQVKERELRA